MKRIILPLAVLFLLGCSGTPKGFTPAEDVHRHVSYRLSNETAEGFDLEVAYLEYSFVTVDSAPVIERARGHFLEVAKRQAAARGRGAEPIPAVRLQATISRNEWDGVNTLFIGDRVLLGGALPAGPPVPAAAKPNVPVSPYP